MDKHRHRLTLPKKGTQLRATMLLMLRTQGATSLEVREACNSPHRSTVNAQMIKIVDFLGFDVRQLPNYDKAREGRVVYKIVGRDRATSGYRAFTFNDLSQR